MADSLYRSLVLPLAGIAESMVTRGRSPGNTAKYLMTDYDTQQQNAQSARQAALQEQLYGQQIRKGEIELGGLEDDQTAAKNYARLKAANPDWNEEQLITAAYSPEQRNFRSFMDKKAAERQDPDAPMKSKKLGLEVSRLEEEPKRYKAETESKTEKDLREEFYTRSKDFIQVRDSHNRVEVSAKDPSAAGDLALIFNYMKVLDPGSAVREQEFANAQNAGSVPNRVISAYNRVLSGERLSDEQRKDFLNRSRRLYASKASSQKNTIERYTNLAKNKGIDPVNVVEPLKLDVIQNDAEFEQLAPGTQFIDPMGNLRIKP